jgi:hypothetical protein
MVQLIPGISFVYYIDDNPTAAHTVACLHTLESLQPDPCFSNVLELSVQLSKLTYIINNNINLQAELGSGRQGQGLEAQTHLQSQIRGFLFLFKTILMYFYSVSTYYDNIDNIQ